MGKLNILPKDAGKVMAKLETWVFCPALTYKVMSKYCTVDLIKVNLINIIFSIIGVAISVTIAIFLSRLFVKKESNERGIYAYALAIANGGYMGDPLVQTLFGDNFLALYKIFYLPISIVIYTWGVSVLVPKDRNNANCFKNLFNAPTVSTIISIIVGLSGLGSKMPVFVDSTVNSLSACMGPVAMLLAGFTVANYSIKNMLCQKKVYCASILRLIILPSIIITILFLIKNLANIIFGLNIDNTVIFLAFFATATPLGLNTVVFPEAYGGNPETGASMTLISHIMCILTIPLMYSLLITTFG